MLFKINARNFSSSASTELKKTALYNFHKDTMKARIVPFAGYHMPVSYPAGGVAEHLFCRKSVGLFDVSHMG
jgi:aminomethyltransferase